MSHQDKTSNYSLILMIWLLACPYANADREPMRSLGEMEQASSLVIDGAITEITDIGTEENPHPDGKSVIRTHHRAIFRIEKVHKGQVLGNADSVHLEYWRVFDSRYKGEVAPDLKVNDRFRLYAETVTTDSSGATTVFVHTRNSVRPEALDTTTPKLGLPTEKDASALSTKLPKAEDHSSTPGDSKPPGRETTLSMRWAIIAALIVIVIAYLILKKRN